MALCRSCNAPIVWARTEAGRAIPLDQAPQANGNVHLREDGVAVYLTKAQLDSPMFPASRRRVSHFATCPNARLHRRVAK